jgi:DNA-binding transcriptional LysR family regulator
MQAIEAQTGCRLLERKARGVRLTPAGDTFARHARAMLLEADSMRAALRDFSGGLQGQVTIRANTTATTEFMAVVLAKFLSSHPLVSVNLKEQSNQEIIRGVREGRADLGIVAGDLDLSGLSSVHFASDRLVVVASRAHRLAQKADVTFAEVIKYPTVGMYDGSTIKDFLARRVEAMGQPEQRPRVEVNSFEALCLMAEAEVGLGIAPESAARHYGKRMHVAVVPLSDAWAVRDRFVVMREAGRVPPLLRDLVELVCKHHSRDSSL